MRVPYHLVRHELLTVRQKGTELTDDGGVDDDYQDVGTCYGAFIPFSRSWVVNERYGQGATPNASQFELDLRETQVTVGVETRLRRPDGSEWQITQMTSDNLVAQVDVEQV